MCLWFILQAALQLRSALTSSRLQFSPLRRYPARHFSSSLDSLYQGEAQSVLLTCRASWLARQCLGPQGWYSSPIARLRDGHFLAMRRNVAGRWRPHQRLRVASGGSSPRGQASSRPWTTSGRAPLPAKWRGLRERRRQWPLPRH